MGRHRLAVLLLPLLHLVVAALVALLGRRLGRWAFGLAAVAPAATLGWALAALPGVLDGEVQRASVTWIPGLGVELALRADGLGVLMALLVSGIGLLVLAYAPSYFEDLPDPGRVAAPLTVFAGGMLTIVLADDVWTLFVGWETTTITSYLLVGLDDRRAAARSAALQALLTTSLGGLALLGGLVLVSQEAGTTTLSQILADPPSSAVAQAGWALLLVGAATKSAQVPFHAWLPGAMSAPTPVSAYLHSATMVKAGVYLVARVSTGLVAVLGWWRPVVVAIGLTTLVLGGWRALRETDLKLVLASGTVSQLGLLVATFGLGVSEATLAAVVLLLGHALFKASLFLTVGIVDHAAHTRDLRRLSGLARPLAATAGVMAVGAASMAGLPPLLGFIGKEKVYEAFVGHGPAGAWGVVAAAVVVGGSMLTVAYSARLLWGAFATKHGEELDERPVDTAALHRPTAWFLAPPAVLAALSLAFGLAPGLVEPLVQSAAGSLDPKAAAKDVVLWAGFTLPLLLSLITVAVGLGAFALRRALARAQGRLPAALTAQRGYERALEGALQGARGLTGRVQTGSLTEYLGVILTTVVVVPGVVLVADGLVLPDDLVWADHPLQVVAAVVAVVAALATLRMDSRLGAFMVLGACGYAVAGLFALQGGPDLAVTQLLVETLVVVALAVVLRRLPPLFTRRALVRRSWRVVVALAVGAFTSLALLAADAQRTAPPASEEQLALSEPEAGGRNVVNVILVDFRGADTVGEIAVVATATLGAAGLVMAGRRRAGGQPAGDQPAEAATATGRPGAEVPTGAEP